MARTRSRELVTTLLDAAERVLANGRPPTLSARTVAAEARVSVQSIYNRFGSFEALLDDLANRGFRDLGRQILDLELAPLPDAGDPLAILVEALNRYRVWALDRPELHRFMFEADLSTRTRQTADRTVGIIVAAAGNGARAGLLLPEPAPLLANRLLAALHGSLQLELTGWTTGPGDNVATMLRGLTPTAQLR